MIACDLCALDCGTKPFELVTPEKTLHFCCEGCRGIWMMIHDIAEAPRQAQNDSSLSHDERKSP
ncbi:metal-binding protein [Sulfuricystis multivorans]|uniref:metal-binding protein n=1 Tax=Sulfuricystis multivorans TaxID=2211108 RepID=UPI000F83AF8B|nr:metal-binding protein [Sulfuricystis multivorans]